MISRVLAYTAFKKNKQAIISCLFLIYYIVYAISPLSYTYSVKTIVKGISAEKGTPYPQKRLNIFLLELICSKIDANKDVDQNNATDRVLIRKTRAILPENTNSRVAPVGTLTLFEGFCLLSDNSVSGSLASSNQQKSRWQFNALHSGLSPPLA